MTDRHKPIQDMTDRHKPIPTFEAFIKEDQSDTYFDTLSQALEQVNRVAVKKGYDEINPDLFFKFGTGGISYTTTKSDRFELTKGGEPVKNRSMQVQIYRMDSGKYELNCYIA